MKQACTLITAQPAGEKFLSAVSWNSLKGRILCILSPADPLAEDRGNNWQGGKQDEEKTTPGSGDGCRDGIDADDGHAGDRVCNGSGNRDSGK